MRSCVSKIIIIFAIALLFSCSSTPKHTNTLMFATTTKFALDVSFEPTAGGSPDITVGYKRHEGVWMPLLANQDSNDTMVPADCGTVGDCLYQSQEGNNNNIDTYSVLASFGAKFGAGAQGKPGEGTFQPSASASGGLAQFFATGLAARKLAEMGNARLVAIQPADTEALNDAKERAKEAEKRSKELENKLIEKLGAERTKEFATEGEALKEARKAKKAAILALAAPLKKFDKQKWDDLVKKSDLDVSTKKKMEEVGDYPMLNGMLTNQLTSKDAKVLESLYKALNAQQ